MMCNIESEMLYKLYHNKKEMGQRNETGIYWSGT